MSPPNGPVSRRTFLAASAGIVVAACSGDDAGDTAEATTTTTGSTSTSPPTTASTTTTTVPVPAMTGDPFTLGVASGDPLADAVVIWTRVAPDPFADDAGVDGDQVPVQWAVATDEAFTEIIADGTFVTTAAHGHSVHVDVTDLDPATSYWYQFAVGDWASPVGRTRTAPAPGAPTEQLSFAVANCAAYLSGYFTAYAHLAEEEDLDAVVFVGDYIYELEGGTTRSHGLDLNPTTLAEYRAFYVVARLEEPLALAHANHPWIVMWDDHEVEDNYAGWNPGGIGLLVDPNAADTFRDRRTAAYQAWWEFMPVRTGPPIDGVLQVYRDFTFGDLAKLTMIDDRQYRSAIVQGDGDGDLPRPFGGGPQLEGTFDESRTMLGEEQEAWFESSIVHGATWALLGQQTIMAEVDRAPDDPTRGFSMDAWDGYAAPRERLLGYVHDQGVENFVVLGGDIHTSAVADLHVSYREPGSPMVGTEFVAPSITSLELLLPEFVEGSRSNPHVHLYEKEHRGYLRVDMTHEELLAHYRWVDTTAEPTSPISTASTWRVRSGEVGVEEVTA
ncbi:MAG: alkaline phosphatase D family protein [Acidimicrobiales bacterium]|nr:alkaline phosphatase D family protein [Acidimicrobiales bacterium]